LQASEIRQELPPIEIAFGESVVIRSVIALVALALATPSIAQMPQTRPLTVTFSGVVTNDVSDTISIRQPDGSFAPYRGPVPAYDYRRGDQVTIGFTTTVPTNAYYAANPNVPRADDGIYRFNVQGPNAGTNGFGVTRNFDVSGPLSPATDFGIGGITLVYNANTESYSLEFPRGTWGASYFSGPSYTYDAGTGALITTGRNCFSGSCTDGATLTGSADTVQLINQIGDARQPVGPVGFFTLLFNGSWNLPVSNPGGPTPVPEPGTVFLFGAGAAWLVRRARKKAA
jgi:PEP-CTERM motif